MNRRSFFATFAGLFAGFGITSRIPRDRLSLLLHGKESVISDAAYHALLETSGGWVRHDTIIDEIRFHQRRDAFDRFFAGMDRATAIVQGRRRISN